MKLFQTGKSLGCGKFGEVVQCRYLFYSIQKSKDWFFILFEENI
jgi:hypothetical protein